MASYAPLMDTNAGLTWQNWLNLAAYAVNVGTTLLSMTNHFGPSVEAVSRKYQTLVTPAAWAFAIWGLIFSWEAIFVVAQMFPSLRGSVTAKAVAPYWAVACAAQSLWYLAWQREWMILAFVLLLVDLLGLLGAMFAVDSKSLPGAATLEWWLLRAPFSVHAGWVIAANNVALNVVAEYLQVGPSRRAALAVFSFALVSVVAACFAAAYVKPDAIICLVAAWALMAVSVELKAPAALLDQTRALFYAWPPVLLDGLQGGAELLALLCLGFAITAAVVRLWPSVKSCAA